MHCHIKYWKTKGVGRCSPSIIQHNWNEQMIWNDGKKHILLRRNIVSFIAFLINVHPTGNIK